MPAKRIRIEGNVQGVFFRALTLEHAERLELRGWVRNTFDRAVEIHAEGTVPSLKELEAWCHEGPRNAHVERVEVTEVPEEGYTSFTICS